MIARTEIVKASHRYSSPGRLTRHDYIDSGLYLLNTNATYENETEDQKGDNVVSSEASDLFSGNFSPSDMRFDHSRREAGVPHKANGNICSLCSREDPRRRMS